MDSYKHRGLVWGNSPGLPTIMPGPMAATSALIQADAFKGTSWRMMVGLENKNTPKKGELLHVLGGGWWWFQRFVMFLLCIYPSYSYFSWWNDLYNLSCAHVSNGWHIQPPYVVSKMFYFHSYFCWQDSNPFGQRSMFNPRTDHQLG